MITKPWTHAEDNIIREMARRGFNTRQCAGTLSRTRNSVLGRAYRLGVHFSKIWR